MFSLPSLFNILRKKICLTSLRQYLKGIRKKSPKAPKPCGLAKQAIYSSVSNADPATKGKKCCPFLSSASTCKLTLAKNYGDMGRERGQRCRLVASWLSPWVLGQGLLHSTSGCLIDFHKSRQICKSGRSSWPNCRLSRAAPVSKCLPAALFHPASRCCPGKGKPGLVVTTLSWEASVCHRVTAWPRASHLISLSFSFPPIKGG